MQRTLSLLSDLPLFPLVFQDRQFSDPKKEIQVVKFKQAGRLSNGVFVSDPFAGYSGSM